MGYKYIVLNPCNIVVIRASIYLDPIESKRHGEQIRGFRVVKEGNVSYSINNSTSCYTGFIRFYKYQLLIRMKNGPRTLSDHLPCYHRLATICE